MRTALMRTIFAACRDLGLDDEDRKSMQMTVTGKTSMAEMSDAELLLVIDNLKAKGFKLKPKGRRPMASRADLRLIHVLWSELGKAGVLTRPDRAGLNAFIRSRFGEAWGSVPADVDMMCDQPKIEAVIRALRSMCNRHGVELRQ